MRLYRSTIQMLPGMIGAERSMTTFTQTSPDAAFVLIEDPLAMQGSMSAMSQDQPTPSHYQYTLVPVSPPGALEQLLQQLNAPWTMRQAGGGSNQSGRQLLIDGHIFTIGSDWVVCVGNVILAGGTLKGMILEAEYLPIPDLRSPLGDGNPEFISGFLISLLPNIPDARNVICTIPDNIWEDVLWDREAEERKWLAGIEERRKAQEEKRKAQEEKGKAQDEKGKADAARDLASEGTLGSVASSDTMATAPPDSQPPSQSQTQPSQSQAESSQTHTSQSQPSQSDAMDEDKAPPADPSAPSDTTEAAPQPPSTSQPPPSTSTSQPPPSQPAPSSAQPPPPPSDDDIFASPDDPEPFSKYDWIGPERDRRSAFSIIMALRSEGLL
ncbi:uncharacterized protein SCHCODRAFT_02621261 [Schizophyllum commune H4-8]|uniref:Mediator complex subunit 20 n=1 Tax=Schizophyllum commune (strain H4-8 / FGSC 9210) TaxID=578458 RepID=D8PNU9_SCHCM|nr:uncharacterized protein SCHCODRAFT_02621261 [Schizophyllum commune H4-8]KAI5893256.1 hypothetical protein SCHCODRAFT_02621261 [Schizophyllum commune H4-8]